MRLGLVGLALAQALAHAGAYCLCPSQAADARPDPNMPHWHAYMFEMIFILAAFGDRRSVLAWSENPLLRWLGLGLYLLSAFWVAWADFTWALHLRRYGQQSFANPVLLEIGPFKFVRYPSLTYLLLMSLGFALAFRSWIGLLMLLPLLATLLNRIRILDGFYAQMYRSVWDARCQASKRIFPFLY